MTSYETILQEAERVVGGERQEAYGDPSVQDTRLGRLWGAILGIEDIPPRTVALMMVALKVSRDVTTPRRDNLVDIAGYARTIEMME